MGNTVGQQPVALTVGVFGRREFHYYGFDSGYFGTLAPVPFWGDNVRLGTLAYFEDEYRTRCAPTDRSCFFLYYSVGVHEYIREDGCIADSYNRREIGISVRQSKAYLEMNFVA